jgi:hypothetical protein
VWGSSCTVLKTSNSYFTTSPIEGTFGRICADVSQRKFGIVLLHAGMSSEGEKSQAVEEIG